MTTFFTDVDWQFDAERWAADLKNQRDADLVAAQGLSGLSAGAWWHWLNPKKGKEFQHPNMSNFIKVCNLLQLDPRDYFCLNIPEKTNDNR